MAALHLLPRELVHLLANKPLSLPVLPCSTSGLRCPRSSSLESLFFNRQLLRFSSDYRRVSLDSETARDFDRPSKGYDYPSITSSKSSEWLDVASFTEEDSAEYSRSSYSRQPTPPASSLEANASPQDAGLDFSTSAAHTPSSSSAEVAQEGIRSRRKADTNAEAQILSGIRKMTYGNAANCLRRGDLDSAVGWFADAPVSSSVPVSSGGRQLKDAERLLTFRLRDALMDQRPNDAHLLMRFVKAAAQRGHLAGLGEMVSHLARFTSYRYFRPFWFSTVHAAKDFNAGCGRRAPSRIGKLSDAIRVYNNKIIRSLCLAARYTEAVDFVGLVRAVSSPITMEYPESHGQASPPIERFTYKLLLEELSRANIASETIQDIMSLRDRDYPAADTPSETDLETIDTQHFTTPAEEQENLARSIYPNAVLLKKRPAGSLGPMLRMVTRGRASWGRLRRSDLAPLKVQYAHLSSRAHKGELISEEELSQFRAACTQRNCLYLYRTLKYKMTMSNCERERRNLLAQMQQGVLPSATKLDKFIDECLRARQPQVAALLGRWMMMQGARFRGLWISARIRRLVRSRNPRHAVDALQLYARSYLLSGLPANLERYLRDIVISKRLDQLHSNDNLLLLLPPVGLNKPRNDSSQPPKMMPSSHTMTLVLEAWLTLDNSLTNITTTYNSFMSMYFAQSQAQELPLPMMPDQVSFGPFLNRLCKQGHSNEALRIMHDLKNRGIMPNAHNWDTVIGGYAKEGNEEMVSKLFDRMDEARMRQSDLLRDPLPPEAPETAETAQGEGEATPATPATAMRSPTVLHLSSTPASGQSLDGFTLYPPNLVTYVTVVRGFCLANKVNTAQRYLRKMLVARTPSGERLYRFGENSFAEATFKIVRSMEEMRELGKRTSRRRELRSPGNKEQFGSRGSDSVGVSGGSVLEASLVTPDRSRQQASSVL